MQKPVSLRPAVPTDAIVRRVDLLNRELTADAGDGEFVFDVPPDCPVTLRGERIKLRLVQARDHVRVMLERNGGTMTARAIEVQPDHPGKE